MNSDCNFCYLVLQVALFIEHSACILLQHLQLQVPLLQFLLGLFVILGHLRDSNHRLLKRCKLSSSPIRKSLKLSMNSTSTSLPAPSSFRFCWLSQTVGQFPHAGNIQYRILTAKKYLDRNSQLHPADSPLYVFQGEPAELPAERLAIPCVRDLGIHKTAEFAVITAPF